MIDTLLWIFALVIIIGLNVLRWVFANHIIAMLDERARRRDDRRPT